MIDGVYEIAVYVHERWGTAVMSNIVQARHVSIIRCDEIF